MPKSYVGIASREGLVAFRPEHAWTTRALAAAAYRESAPARKVCCWAVLGDDEAAAVRRELDAGDPARALVTLNQLATQLGTVLPSDLRELSPPPPAVPTTRRAVVGPRTPIDGPTGSGRPASHAAGVTVGGRPLEPQPEDCQVAGDHHGLLGEWAYLSGTAYVFLDARRVLRAVTPDRNERVCPLTVVCLGRKVSNAVPPAVAAVWLAAKYSTLGLSRPLGPIPKG